MSSIGTARTDLLETEKQDNRFNNIDQLSVQELVAVMNQADSEVAAAVAKQGPSISEAIEQISKRYAAGGRIIYVGAGTSGRLATLDASEIYPTFGIGDRFIAVMAGGRDALVVPVEGAEDSFETGILDVQNINLEAEDSLVGIASSGATPYVL